MRLRIRPIAALALAMLALPAAASASPTPALSVPVPPSVTVVSPSDGRLDAFTRNPYDGSLSHMAWTMSGGWSDWEVVPGPRLDIDTEIAAIPQENATIDVFARSVDDHVVVTRWNAKTGWGTSWKTLPGSISAGPTASWSEYPGDPTIRVVTVSEAKPAAAVPPSTTVQPAEPATIQVMNWDRTTQTAGSWSKVAGAPALMAGTAPAVVQRQASTVDMWLTGADGRLYVSNRYSNADWTTWNAVASPALRSTPVIARRPNMPNDIDIAVGAADGSLWVGNSVAPGALSSGSPLGGTFAASTPGLAYYHPSDAITSTGTPDEQAMVFGYGGDALLRTKTYRWDNTGWSTSWAGPIRSNQPDPTAAPIGLLPQSLTAVSPSPGRTDIFVRSPYTNALLHTAWTGSWGAWESIGVGLDSTSDVVALPGTNRIDVFTRAQTGQLMTRAWTSSQGWASAWSVISGTYKSGPSVAVPQMERSRSPQQRPTARRSPRGTRRPRRCRPGRPSPTPRRRTPHGPSASPTALTARWTCG